MTFKRPAHLMQAIRSLINAPSLNKIVVIWNDDEQGRSYVDSGMPQFLREHKLRRPVEVVITRTNDVTNRCQIRWGSGQAAALLPPPHSEMHAVFNMDDDTTVDLGTLEFGFSIWKKHPDQVIGFFDRVIFWDTATGQYVYGYDAGVVAPEKYGIVIGKAWIASVELLQLAENDQDLLLMRMREFLHDPQREQKGCKWPVYLHFHANLSMLCSVMARWFADVLLCRMLPLYISCCFLLSCWTSRNFAFWYQGDDIAWNMFLHLRGAKPPIGLAGVRMDDIITWDGESGRFRLGC
eukprot:scaffold101192_cov22-Tisochrysis_lutea.AAC.2